MSKNELTNGDILWILRALQIAEVRESRRNPALAATFRAVFIKLDRRRGERTDGCPNTPDDEAPCATGGP